MYPIPQTAHTLLGATVACIYFNIATAQEFETPIRVLQQTGNISDGRPWNIPASDFDSILSNRPNATGSFPVAGPNISVAASDSSNIDGWSWSISVAADIPIGNSSWEIPERNQSFTGGKLTFNGPSSLLSSSQRLTVNDDWRICLYSWQLDNVRYPSQLRDDDGTCSTVLSPQCASDLKKAVQTSRGRCSCPKAGDLPSCTELGEKSALWSNTCYAFSYDTAAIREWEEGKLEYWLWGADKAHDPGNLTAYNYIGGLSWPVMASFYNGSESKATTLTCARAKDAVEGSMAPTREGLNPEQQDGQGGDKGSGATKRATIGWLLAVSLLLMVV